MEDRLNKLKRILVKAQKEIKFVSNFSDLERLKNKFLGRKEELSQILRGIKDLPQNERKKIGKLGNEVKEEIEEMIEEREKSLGEEERRDISLDLTIPGEKIEPGHLHPLTQFLRKVIDIFVRMGFEVVEGPEVETSRYNFDLLNIPKNHPARDMWDTYYIVPPDKVLGKERKSTRKQKIKDELLLRTHTSPMQLRAMEKRRPPVRLIVPGRVFRHEATDSSHETTFYQCEGLVIDRDIKVTDLIGTIELFLKTLFGKKVKMRVRPHYYPFTEPSLDFDMSCLLCGGKGCRVCGGTGWLEMMGSGMVHPKVLKNMKIDPEEYTGFAFGMGIDRFMMLYYGIDDIRLSYKGDLRFLEQF